MAVVIPTRDYACFLADAVASALAQTHPADEVIVVDDGSTDDPGAVLAGLAQVKLIHQEARGLAAARNAGWRASGCSHVVFLDADDLLLPHALASGLAFRQTRPECALVYGGYQNVTKTLAPLGEPVFRATGPDAHRELLLGNPIGMVGAAIFRRDCLEQIGGFDASLPRCEDYDCYLRLAWKYPIAGHPAIVAQYRRHPRAMSADCHRQLEGVLYVLDRHATRIELDAAGRAALRQGRANWRYLYVTGMLMAARDGWRQHRSVWRTARQIREAARWSVGAVLRAAGSAWWRTLRQAARSRA